MRRTVVCFGVSLLFAVISAAMREGDALVVAIASVEMSANTNRESPEASIVALGKRLFFDVRLSADGKISCATCHRPEMAFTDALPVARGVAGRFGTRNTPSVLNVAFAKTLFWDGRRTRLEQQVTDPFFNTVEHDLPDAQALLASLEQDADLLEEFHRAFGIPDRGEVTLDHVAQALATYLRTLRSEDSPFDLYYFGKHASALSDSAKLGLELFQGRAQCASCHTIAADVALFTDDDFHSLGVGMQDIEARLPELAKSAYHLDARALDKAVLSNRELATLGRFLVTKRPSDIGKFKTPSLRNVAVTAPYMHDGSVTSLEEAIQREVYYRGLAGGSPIVLTVDEKAALLDFLRALTDREYTRRDNQ
jgi:cytochrome c peroxidase